jgi:hypothetical protein
VTDEPLIRTLSAVLQAFADAGLVVTGELNWVRPHNAALIDRIHVEASLMEPGFPGRITATAVPAARQPIPVAADDHPEYLPRKDTGAVCVKCGSPNLRWAGACQVCQDCGESNGCG